MSKYDNSQKTGTGATNWKPVFYQRLYYYYWLLLINIHKDFLQWEEIIIRLCKSSGTLDGLDIADSGEMPTQEQKRALKEDIPIIIVSESETPLKKVKKEKLDGIICDTPVILFTSNYKWQEYNFQFAPPKKQLAFARSTNGSEDFISAKEELTIKLMQKELVLKEREIELKDLMIHEKKVQLGLIPYSSSAYNDENSPDHLLTIG